MNILIANKFHYRRGGDCIAALGLKQLLESKGHKVAFYAMDYPLNNSSEWQSYWPSEMTGLKAVVRPFGSSEVRKSFSKLLADFKPDVVHLHNIHTQLSPIIAQISHEKGIPVVWTVHDTKMVCPAYRCSRNGVWCQECFTSPTAVIRYRCLHGSLPGSIIGYLEGRKWSPERLQRYTRSFIAPSRFMKDILVGGGYSPAKVKVLSNFISEANFANLSHKKEDHYVFLGRIDDMKGINTLLDVAASLPHRLVVIGDGPLLPELRAKYAGCSNISFMGQMQWSEFRPLVESARFMVIPSECSENNPLNLLESLGLGTPVLGARIGGIPELIEESVNGMTFASGDKDSLRQGIERMFEHNFDYAKISGDAMERYSAEAYYRSLMEIYGKK